MAEPQPSEARRCGENRSIADMVERAPEAYEARAVEYEAARALYARLAAQAENRVGGDSGSA